MAKTPKRTRGVLEAQAPRSFVVRQVILPMQSFLYIESVGSLVLLVAAVTALIWANSPWREAYFALWHNELTFDLALFSVSMDLHHWVNDGLMTLFFFVVGLEIKRELVHGELADWRRASLPAAAALGGVIIPALIYLTLNTGTEGARGWGIPMATDIAFALGALAVLGNRIPSTVRVFLLALAIIDDIVAILVIALFYSGRPDFVALGMAAVWLGVIAAMRRSGVLGFGPYVVIGSLLWVAVYQSGIHATLSGVVLGLMTPSSPYYSRSGFLGSARELLGRFEQALAQGKDDHAESLLGQFEQLSRGTEPPLERLERILHPWASYLILPLFALANAGVELSAAALSNAATSPIAWGIALGLILGKLAGITGFSWLALRTGLAALPNGMRWGHLAGVGLLAGIGFTVSLFITELAFTDRAVIDEAKLGILAASIVAGAGGYLWLLRVAALAEAEPGRPASTAASAV